MEYKDVESRRPFYILRPNQDITVWRKGEHGLEIYFHSEGFWCNPPTDTNMEYTATKKIEKYGIAYLTNPDEYIEGYKKTSWKDCNAYRQEYADKFFAQWLKKEGQS
jgi:hypothetical protein